MVSALLICSDDETYRRVRESLPAERAKLVGCTSTEQARAILAQRPIALVIADADVGDRGYREMLQWIRSENPRVPVIVLSRVGDWKEYLDAKQLGAYDCLPWPLNHGELERVVEQALSDSTQSDEEERSPA
jgi:DNA-binding NtrC family response regulator